ncbi:MAG: hypothetical protein ACKV2O_03180 [Acidimicrobiales bacterium]
MDTVGNGRGRAGGRLVVEAWSPDYGSPLEDTPSGPGAEPAPVDVNVEVPARAWEPRLPNCEAAPTVAFVDGVRRVDANLVWTGPDGRFHAGMAASVAAGVVCCTCRPPTPARIVSIEVDRVLLLPVPVGDLATGAATWRQQPLHTDRDDPGSLSIELQTVMAELEVAVAGNAANHAAAAGSTLAMVIIDGPIRRREHIEHAVGHVKTHHQQYLPPELAPIVGQLRAGERTPIFAIEGPFPRLSWYLRLPGPATHAWAGVVRHEIALTAPATATAMADLAAATVVRFASRPARDPRAPQNLTPISGLESRLRHRLGDANLLYRSLRRALG